MQARMEECSEVHNSLRNKTKKKKAASYKSRAPTDTFYFPLGEATHFAAAASNDISIFARHFHSIQADAIPAVRDRQENKQNKTTLIAKKRVAS